MEYSQTFSALHNAALRGSLSELASALETDACLETRSRSMTPLQSAAHCGHYHLLPHLLSAGASITAQPSEFGCALQAAISSVRFDQHLDLMKYKDAEHIARKLAAQKEAVNFLLAHGAGCEVEGGEFGTPLAAAAAFGRTELVRLLLSKGADPSSKGGRLGSALQAACSRGGLPIEWCISLAQPEDYSEIQAMLLQAGANVDHVGGVFGTALQGAAFIGDEEAVAILLSNGASPHVKAGKYGSALGAARSQGHTATMERLLGSGSKEEDLNATSPRHPHDDWDSWREEPVSSLLLGYGAALPSSKVRPMSDSEETGTSQLPIVSDPQ